MVSAAAALDDIAGIRVVCPFVSDVYEVARMLTAQDDVEVLRTKDYIAEPEGERLPQPAPDRGDPGVPVRPGRARCKVEVQLRTIAMDFWATLEHKLFYKYDDSPTRRTSWTS